MFYGEADTTLDPRIVEVAEELKTKLTNNKHTRFQYNKRHTVETDPPMLQMFHSAYRTQCLLEVAQLIVRDNVAEQDAINLFFRWLPALVNHYHSTVGHNMVVVYATARNQCVDGFTKEFLLAYINLLVENSYSVATGASTTGGMGVVTEMMSTRIKDVGFETTKSRCFGVRLGLIKDVGQAPAKEVDYHAPPLYIFALRMYYLNLIGGCSDTSMETGLMKAVRRNRLIIPGGLGSLSECISDLVELQTSKFANTTYSHAMKQEFPYFIFVGPSASAIRAYNNGKEDQSLTKIASRDADIVTKWQEIRNLAIEIDALEVDMDQRYQKLIPHVEKLVILLVGSGLFYRGLLLQLTDCLLNGTVSAKELIPVEFVQIDTPKEAAKRVFELHNSKRGAIEELHQGHKINYRA